MEKVLKYVKNVFMGIDQLGNAVAGGNPDTTISARVGYHVSGDVPTSFFWVVMRRVIDFTFEPLDGEGHCLDAYMGDREDLYEETSDVMLGVLAIIIIPACIILTPLVRLLALLDINITKA